MSLQDPIADMLTRVKNAHMAKKTDVVMPSSKIKVAIAKVLVQEGFASSYTVSDAVKPELSIALKYCEGRAVIEEIKRYSRPGLRRYAGKDGLPRVRDGLGLSIVSTCHGVVSDRDARRMGVGGEVLCTVW